ncbi:MAG: hypothetical protein Q8P67_03460 [archaeon]|nr:hypothetical protein [archaeon]
MSGVGQRSTRSKRPLPSECEDTGGRGNSSHPSSGFEGAKRMRGQVWGGKGIKMVAAEFPLSPTPLSASPQGLRRASSPQQRSSAKRSKRPFSCSSPEPFPSELSSAPIPHLSPALSSSSSSSSSSLSDDFFSSISSPTPKRQRRPVSSAASSSSSSLPIPTPQPGPMPVKYSSDRHLQAKHSLLKDLHLERIRRNPMCHSWLTLDGLEPDYR